MNKIILASQSPRRKQLLEWAEIEFDVIVSDTNESFPSNLTFEEIAIHIAQNKAQKVQNDSKSILPILAADTIVVCNDEIYGKPTDRNDAIKMLQQLSGKTHQVITGVCIIHNNQMNSFADITEVTFHDITQEQISYYIDEYKPFDKAGSYAIQEWIGVVGIASIKGDFYNVMGLPVSRVVQALKTL